MQSSCSFSVYYTFSQEFDFPAKDAFDWSMDYKEDDLERMGLRGSRKIERLNDETLVVTDTYFGRGKRISKRRLIRIYPELLTMVNTRISEANRYSQFIYKFVPLDNSRSRLDFSGSHVFYERNPGPSKIKSLANKMASEDSTIWKNLARAMKEDLG